VGANTFVLRLYVAHTERFSAPEPTFRHDLVKTWRASHAPHTPHTSLPAAQSAEEEVQAASPASTASLPGVLLTPPASQAAHSEVQLRLQAGGGGGVKGPEAP
jgi:hypothetical protein